MLEWTSQSYSITKMKFIEDNLKHNKNISLDDMAEVYSACLIKQMSRHPEKSGLIKYIEDKHNAIRVADRYFSILTYNIDKINIYRLIL